DGLNDPDGTDGDEVIDHHDRGCSHSGANHNWFGSSRASRRGLFNDDPGHWRHDAIQLEHQFGSAASRADSVRGNRNDLRNTDDIRLIHILSEGDGFDLTDSTNGFAVVYPHDCNSTTTGADHDQFGSVRASRKYLFDDTGSKWWLDALQLEHHLGSVAGRPDAVRFQRDNLWGTDDVRNVYFCNSGQ